MDAHAPIAELVAKPLEQHRLIGRQGAGCRRLLTQIGQEVAGGELVQARIPQPRSGTICRQGADLADESAECPTEFSWAAGGVAFPEGQSSRRSRGGGDQNLIVGDQFDSPAGGSKGKDVADPGLVNHFLIEFAYPAACGVTTGCGAFSDEEDSEQPSVRDRAT